MQPAELTEVPPAAGGKAPGAVRARALAFADSELAASVPVFFLSFALIFILGADKAGYWPTAWGWTSLVLLFVAAVVLIVRNDVRIGSLEAVLPAGLLLLTLWQVASSAWSPSATLPILNSQRTLSYAAAVFAALLIVRIGTYRAFLAGVLSAITLVCGYGLLTRLFPERLGSFDNGLAGQRLQAPLGYWNSLALFAGMGTLLALGFAARGRSLVVRALAAASIVVLVPTLYFTFSRGGWVALIAGLVVLVALDRRRLQLVTVAAVVAPWPLLAVWHASRIDALTHLGFTAAAAQHEGRRYLSFLLLLALGAAVSAVVFALLEKHVHVPRPVRVGYGVLLLLVVAAAAGGVMHRYGSPTTLAHKTYHHLVGQDHPVTNGDLNTRLFSIGLGARIPQFRVAWHEYKAHPYLGTGEGSYERYWNEYRPYVFTVRNVHDLYLETLAELGPVGLALLLVALAAPIVAFFRVRKRGLTAAALAAYIAFLVHVLVDWDWQMPAVTLAALFCGTAVLSAAKRARPQAIGPVPRGILVGVVIGLGVFAFIGLRSNLALASSRTATAQGNYAKAASEAKAARSWAPWSADPWQLLGEAQLALGKRAAAAASFRRALAKDDANWWLWLDLAQASKGAARRQAIAEVTRLNPLGPEVASLQTPTGGAG